MFERYTEPARRALFFARLAVSEHGGELIEPGHLLLGVLRADPTGFLRFARSGETEESLAQRIAATMPGGANVSIEHEIPLSRPMKAVLEHACVEADQLNDPSIRPEHLLLGVFVKGSDEQREALRQSGVELDAVRKYLQSPPQ